MGKANPHTRRLFKDVRLHKPRIVMNEPNFRRILRYTFHAKVDHGTHVTSNRSNLQNRDVVALIIISEDRSFFCSCKYDHDSLQCRRRPQ